MKQILSAVLFISIIFFSCKKESAFNRNTPSDEVAGARPPGKGKPLPPVANAGPDQTILLPTNTVALDGSASTDPNNNIASYLWTKVSGPSSFTIANPNSVQTQVTNLIEGVYEFELKVTDARGLIDKDIVQATVMLNQLPPCTTCKIVFVSNRDGNDEIFTCNTDGSNLIRLTNDPGYDAQPEWSADGTKIAFISDRSGSPELYMMNADGSNVVQRTFSVDPNGWIQGLTWSPDGTKIAYSYYTYTSDDSYEGGIYVVSAISGSPLLLFAGGFNPAWSPDGTKIAMGAYPDISTINADGTGFTPLTSGINNGYYDFDYPSWSPNGAKLAVVINQNIGDYYGTYISHLGVMNADGSGLTSLVLGNTGARTSWSGDGTIIVYSSQSGSGWNVSWVAATGSASGTIITNGWDADWQH
ncbi:MAG TPA: hypothetical protein VF144_21660 [Chitinophagaceae bacterium]